MSYILVFNSNTYPAIVFERDPVERLSIDPMTLIESTRVIFGDLMLNTPYLFKPKMCRILRR